MRLVPQPREERRGRLERPPFDFGVAEVHQSFERLMESEQVAALEHRAEEGRRSCSWRAPQREHRHRRNVSLNAGYVSSDATASRQADTTAGQTSGCRRMDAMPKNVSAEFKRDVGHGGSRRPVQPGDTDQGPHHDTRPLSSRAAQGAKRERRWPCRRASRQVGVPATPGSCRSS